MNKQTKLAVSLSAAALLTLGTSMTSMAATGWQVVDGTHVYYDSHGELVTNEWRKDGDQYFYLDDDGFLLVNAMQDGYYVGADGARVKNTWVKLVNEDYSDEEVDAHWYFFGSNGKAVEQGWKLINSRYYYFDDSRMLSGWQDIETGSETRRYYLGGEDEGWRSTGWKWISEPEDDNRDTTGEEYWYYFGNNGQSVSNDIKKINGKQYVFDEFGRMITGWAYTEATGSNATYTAVNWDDDNSNLSIGNSLFAFTNADFGNLVTGFIKIDQLNDNSDNAWYYFKDGRAYSSEYNTTPLASNSNSGLYKATIEGKVYCFNADGTVKDGIVVDETKDENGNVIAARKFYFPNIDKDGSMKTGKIKVYDEDEDEYFTYYFATRSETKNGEYIEKGQARSGIIDGYYYQEPGETPSPSDYRLIKADTSERYRSTSGSEHDSIGGYLINTSGKVVKGTASGKVFLDSDDRAYLVNSEGRVIHYEDSKEAMDSWLDK